MADIEKVAKGIDICLLRFRCGVDCPYHDDGCQEKLREDALELLKMLKKQEPLVPCTEGSTTKWDGHLYCRDCGRTINTDSRFCSYCGRAIKWSTD